MCGGIMKTPTIKDLKLDMPTVDGKVKCPICGKPSQKPYTPFCSKRCADIDLNRWLTGSYVIHTDEEPDDETPKNAEE